MRLFEREKEKELYESKIDFFTNVAHEIRTPLSLIKAGIGEKSPAARQRICKGLEFLGLHLRSQDQREP